MVAPSFVTVMSPTSSTSILSSPTGPRDDFTMLAIAAAAATESDGEALKHACAGPAEERVPTVLTANGLSRDSLPHQRQQRFSSSSHVGFVLGKLWSPVEEDS